jgi:hypothetical protein
MAIGSFFIVLDDNAKVQEKVVYIDDETDLKTVDENVLLKIRMGHSDKKFVITVLPDYQYYTYKVVVKEKRKMTTLIGGIILSKDMDPSIYKDALMKFTEDLKVHKSETNAEILEIIKTDHKEYFQRPQVVLDKKELEKGLMEKVKMLNKAGKFDQANLLLDKMKKIPKKLYKAHENAENAIKSEDFDKAEKEFEIAKKHAQDLEEKELVRYYVEKQKLARKIPSLIKKRNELVENALNGMRNDDFSRAQKMFKQASDVCETLLDLSHAEEYALKAKALAEYVMIDRKYKK